jgi:hypothetical protein
MVAQQYYSIQDSRRSAYSVLMEDDESPSSAMVASTSSVASTVITSPNTPPLNRDRPSIVRLETPPSKKLRLSLDDGVAKINARTAQMEAMPTLSTMGADHPHFDSGCCRIPASVEEKRWLFKYFEGNNGITSLFSASQAAYILYIYIVILLYCYIYCLLHDTIVVLIHYVYR